QAEAEDVRRRARGAYGGLGRDGLAVDAERLLERGRGVRLEHGPAVRGEHFAAAVRAHEGSVRLPLVAVAAAGRLLVALLARVRVEQRTQAVLGLELLLEDDLARVEARELLGGEPRE